MGFQSVIRPSHHRVQIRVWILENYRRMNLLVPVVADTHNGAFANFGKLTEDVFDIFRMNVETFRCDDCVLLPAPVVQAAFPIHRAEIASVEPSAIVAGSDTFAASKDLAIGRNHHLQPW